MHKSVVCHVFVSLCICICPQNSPKHMGRESFQFCTSQWMLGDPIFVYLHFPQYSYLYSPQYLYLYSPQYLYFYWYLYLATKLTKAYGQGVIPVLSITMNAWWSTKRGAAVAGKSHQGATGTENVETLRYWLPNIWRKIFARKSDQGATSTENIERKKIRYWFPNIWWEKYLLRKVTKAPPALKMLKHLDINSPVFDL